MRLLLKIALSGLFALLLIEVGLRLLPQVIPLPLLVYFEAGPRTEIATRLGLPTRWGTVAIARDDGGPELRVFKPFYQSAAFTREEGLVISRDEIGFCNQPGSYQQPQLDVVAVGDSFTACTGVTWDDTWTAKLSAQIGRPVFNLGKDNIGLHEYVQILKQFGLPKSPRLVLLTVYEGNDMRDAMLYNFYRNDPAATPAPAEPAATPAGGWLAGHSYAYNLLAAVAQAASGADPAPADAPALDRITYLAQKFSFLPEAQQAELYFANFKYELQFPDQTIAFNPDNADRDEVMAAKLLYTDAAPDIFEGVIADMEAALADFTALAEAHNFTPVVIYMPSAHTVYGDYVRFEDPALAQVMPWFSRWQRSFYGDNGRRLGYHFVDLTDGLQGAAQQAGSDDLLYHFGDLHLTRAGHTAVADLLARRLANLNLAE